MNDVRFTDITQLASFLQGTKKLELTLPAIEDKYIFITDIVKRFSYHKLTKKDKRIVFLYIKKITGYKKVQLYRLIKRALLGDLHKNLYHRNHAPRVYDFSAIKLLEHTDELHLRLNREATAQILKREYELFHHKKYQTISNISSSHIDNLRKTQVYKSSWINGTKARLVPIGETMKPDNNNLPGSLRIDTVHQRDVYHINCVDEITQWEIVICVPQISESYLKPALEELLDQFPFIIFNFHSDRGSEFINKIVADLLNKLLIHQTKSRSRHCNDNALIESKNGSVIRKNMGYFHIDKGMVGKINMFYKNYFNVYLNYHRPCGYVTEIKKDSRGRERKVYGQYTVPYEKLKEVSKKQKKNFLKPSQSFEKLDRIAYQISDNDFAEIMREKQRLLIRENFVIDR